MRTPERYGFKMRSIVNINAKWAFTKEALENFTIMPAVAEWVDLPHSWNAVDGQDGGNDYFRGTAYYAQEFKKEELFYEK